MKRITLFFIASILAIAVHAQKTSGVVVPGSIVPTDTTDNYYTHDDFFGKVYYRSVEYLWQRDVIPSARRMIGMKVFVRQTNRTYRLLDCIENGCWIEDRIDTLYNGTFSTGKITIQPLSDPSMFFDIYNSLGYQRFGVAKSGMLLAGRRFPMAVNVDGLAMIGDRNEVTGADAGAIGKDVEVKSDSSLAFGYNLKTQHINTMLLGRGLFRTQKMVTRWPNSLGIGYGQENPQITLSKDSIKLESQVLWWNGAPIGGSNVLVPGNNLLLWDNTNKWYMPHGANPGTLAFYTGSGVPSGTSTLKLNGKFQPTSMEINPNSNAEIGLAIKNYNNTNIGAGYGLFIDYSGTRSPLRVIGRECFTAMWVSTYSGGIELDMNGTSPYDYILNVIDVNSNPIFDILKNGTITSNSTNEKGYEIREDGTYSIKALPGESLSEGDIVYIAQTGNNGEVSKNPASGTLPVGVVTYYSYALNVVKIVTSGLALVKPQADVTATKGYFIYPSTTTAGTVNQSATRTTAQKIGVFLDNGTGPGVPTRAIVNFN